MADNLVQNATGLVSTDGIVTLNGATVPEVQAQRVKIGFGSDGVFRDADAANGLPVLQNDVTASGSLAAAAQTVVLALNGQSAASIQLSGTWVGTVTFEGSNDGTNWTSVNAVAASTSQPQPTTTVNGLYRLTPGGLMQLRANMTAFTSGSATVSMRASAGVGGIFANQILPTKITDGTNTATIKSAGTTAVSGDLPLVVTVHPNTASQPVQPPTITKGVQGSVGITTQDLKDAGRSRVSVTFMAVAPAVADTLLSLVKITNGAAAAGATSIGVTAGKTLSISSITFAIKSGAAASAFGTLTFRQNPAGATVIGSVAESRLDLGNTASTIGASDRFHLTFPDGMEFSGAQTFGISLAAQAITNTISISINGFEY